jgi:hypothetical protein
LVRTHARLIVGALLAVAVGVVVLLLLFRAASPAPEPMPSSADGMAVRATYAPKSYLFGDQMRAHLEILVDRNVFVPGKIDVDAQFAPFATSAT